MCVFQRKTAQTVKDAAKVRLLLITNKKWHTLFQMTWKLSTLDDRKNHWQPVRSAIIATAGLLIALSQTQAPPYRVRSNCCSEESNVVPRGYEKPESVKALQIRKVRSYVSRCSAQITVVYKRQNSHCIVNIFFTIVCHLVAVMGLSGLNIRKKF